MSIKWKLSLSFIVMSLGFVVLYVLLAKNTFESDKIGYIFESQQSQVDSIARNAENEIRQQVYEARTLCVLASSPDQNVAASSKNFFAGNLKLLFVDQMNVDQQKLGIVMEKAPGTAARFPRPPQRRDPGTLDIEFVGKSQLLVSVYDASPSHEIIRTRFLLNEVGIGERAMDGQQLLLLSGPQVVAESGQGLRDEDLRAFAQTVQRGGADVTRMETVGGARRLVSSASFLDRKLQVVGLIREDVAMGALQILFERSVVFLVFSFFATVILALLLSFSLTKNIKVLTLAAKKIAKGDFVSDVEVKSKDEIGVLAKAFTHMKQEIAKLLQETIGKERMESELKTARLVQESLFPVRPDDQAGILRVAGLYRTSTECGGDWWYQYRRGNQWIIVIADATGHGTPAALITSAARAVFTVVGKRDISLGEIAELWDEAVADCSNGKVFMTAFMVMLDMDTGIGTYVNASHENPVILSAAGEGKWKGEFFEAAPGPTLGEKKRIWMARPFHLEPGKKLVLFTDGLTAIASPEGRVLGDRRLLKVFENTAAEFREPGSYVDGLYKWFNEFGAGAPLPDDVTLVMIENTKAPGPVID